MTIYDTDYGEFPICPNCREHPDHEHLIGLRVDENPHGECYFCGATDDDLFEGRCDGIAASQTYDWDFGRE